MDLKDATLSDIVLDRPDLVEAIEAGEHLPQSVVETEQDAQGRGYKKWKEKIVDIDGKVISSRVEEYTYTKDGVLDTITRKGYSGDEEKLNKEVSVKYEHGKKPVMTEKKNGQK